MVLDGGYLKERAVACSGFSLVWQRRNQLLAGYQLSGRALENLRGGGRSQKPKYVMECIKLNRKIWRWSCVEKLCIGLDLFWNNTID